ncbi:hypothetical protein ACFLZ9_00740 [Patescibacteria group bacterium]
MKINISKKQYQTLIKCVETAGTIYGVMGDMVDEKHKKFSGDIDELSDYVLGFAKEFGIEGIAEKYRGKWGVTEKYMDEFMDDLKEYDEYAFWEMLVRELAKKEFEKKYLRAEIKKMSHEEYLKKIFELEDKYWRWTEKTGLDGLEIKDTGKKAVE